MADLSPWQEQEKALLAEFLVREGLAEAEPGYGHATGEQVAEAIITSDWFEDVMMEARNNGIADAQLGW